MELKLPQLSAKIKITVSREFSFTCNIAAIPEGYFCEALIVFFSTVWKLKLVFRSRISFIQIFRYR